MGIQADMKNEPLILSSDGGVATVTINRPAKKNALTLAMWRDLAAMISHAGADPATRVIIVRGAGHDFSAGADIGEFETVRADSTTARSYEASNAAAFGTIRNSPVPVIAALRGICFGGGFGIAAACDLRIATPDALFSVPAAKLGLAYPAEAMSDIVTALGAQMAKYLTFSAARLDANAALAAGFLMEVVIEQSFEERINGIARSIATNAPLSIRASKAAIRGALTLDPQDAASAATLGDATFDSKDYAEGRAAFIGKRTPTFVGH